MKEQLLAAFKKAHIELPEEVKSNLSEERLAKKAEKIYESTKIELHGTMGRDIEQKAGRLMGDIAVAKIAKKLGIEDAEIVSARLHEKTALLAELRGHDALVRMIMKIAASTGIIQDNPETSPTSTLRALKVGIALQYIYGSLMGKAVEKANREAELQSVIDSHEREIEKLRKQVGYIQKVNMQVEDAPDEKSVILAPASKYFHVHGDKPEYGTLGWISWDTNAQGPFSYDDLPPVNRLKLSTLKKAASFKTAEDAACVVERLGRSALTRRLVVPSSLGVSQLVVKEVE